MTGATDRATRHKRAMQRKKEHVDGRIAAATEDRGLLLVLTGNGKGKSRGFGMPPARPPRPAVAPSYIHPGHLGMANNWFGETRWSSFTYGHGFTWETQDRQTDIAAAQAAWSKAEAILTDEATDLVILDELTYMLTYGYLDKARVLEVLRARPPHQHVVITGRNAGRELLEMADTVSEVKDVRHAFNHGVMAQKGLDY